MTNNTYRILLGLITLIGLYLDLPELVWGLIVIAIMEALTNWRIPNLVCQMRGTECSAIQEGSLGIVFPKRSDIEAERVWRLAVAAILICGLLLSQEFVWYIGWFFGFGILGAGLSGVCPLMLLVRRMGFH